MAIWEFSLHAWWELKPSFTEWVTLILEISQIYFIIKHHLRLTDDKLYTQHFFCGKYLIPGFKIFLHWLYSEKKIIMNYISTLYSFGLFIHDTSSLLTNNNITSSSNQILNIGGQYKSLCPNVKTSIPWNYKNNPLCGRIVFLIVEIFHFHFVIVCCTCVNPLTPTLPLFCYKSFFFCKKKINPL